MQKSTVTPCARPATPANHLACGPRSSSNRVQANDLALHFRLDGEALKRFGAVSNFYQPSVNQGSSSTSHGRVGCTLRISIQRGQLKEIFSDHCWQNASLLTIG